MVETCRAFVGVSGQNQGNLTVTPFCKLSIVVRLCLSFQVTFAPDKSESDPRSDSLVNSLGLIDRLLKSSCV